MKVEKVSISFDPSRPCQQRERLRPVINDILGYQVVNRSETGTEVKQVDVFVKSRMNDTV